MSTSARTISVAAVYLTTCGVIFLPDKPGTWAAQRSTTRYTPNLVRGFRYRLRKTASSAARPATSSANTRSVHGKSGHCRTFPPFPCTVTRACRPSPRPIWRSPTLNCVASETRAPELYKNSRRAYSVPGRFYCSFGGSGKRRCLTWGLAISFSMWQCAGHGNASGTGWRH